MYSFVGAKTGKRTAFFLYITQILFYNANENKIRAEAKYSNFYIYVQQCENCYLTPYGDSHHNKSNSICNPYRIMRLLRQERRSCMKQYDLSGINKLLSRTITPEDLAEKLVQLLFNYSFCVEDGMLEKFKDDAWTIYMLYEEITKLK